MPVVVDVTYQERYASHALNRKFAGIVNPGVYWGYAVEPGGGMSVRIHAGADPDYPESVAVVERNGYSLALRLDGDEVLTIPAPGTWHVVLEASYVVGQATTASLRAAPAVADHHVSLATVIVPAGATAVTAEMIDDTVRDEANPGVLIMRFLSETTALAAENITLKARLARLEAWAQQHGFTAA